jgi:Mn2+/Fe2+ NRAMP family transporter
VFGAVRNRHCGLSDLAEVIGSAIALNLLFGLPLAWGVVFTALMPGVAEAAQKTQ